MKKAQSNYFDSEKERQYAIIEEILITQQTLSKINKRLTIQHDSHSEILEQMKLITKQGSEILEEQKIIASKTIIDRLLNIFKEHTVILITTHLVTALFFLSIGLSVH